MRFQQKAIRVGLIVLFTSMMGASLFAQRNGGVRPPVGRWVYLGEANVDGARDHDTIQVGRQDGRFRAVQIRVERAPIEFQRVIVNYGNGQRDELEFRDRIRAGGTTRALDLKGGDRAITNVEFWYSPATYRGARPRVRLYGR